MLLLQKKRKKMSQGGTKNDYEEFVQLQKRNPIDNVIQITELGLIGNTVVLKQGQKGKKLNIQDLKKESNNEARQLFQSKRNQRLEAGYMIMIQQTSGKEILPVSQQKEKEKQKQQQSQQQQLQQQQQQPMQSNHIGQPQYASQSMPMMPYSGGYGQYNSSPYNYMFSQPSYIPQTQIQAQPQFQRQPQRQPQPQPQQPTSCQSDTDCDSGYFCTKDSCDAQEGTCTECKSETLCAEEYEPVCGCDGQTYGNLCEATRACVNVHCSGECESSESQPQPQESTESESQPQESTESESQPQSQPQQQTSCESDNDCDSTYYCAKETCDCDKGTCTKRSSLCTRLYDPVCGCDGQTYSNHCEAGRFGVNVRSNGECTSQRRSKPYPNH